MARKTNVRCLLGVHSWARRHPPDERYEGPDHMVCRRCGKRKDPVDMPPAGFFGTGSGMA